MNHTQIMLKSADLPDQFPLSFWSVLLSSLITVLGFLSARLPKMKDLILFIITRKGSFLYDLG